MRPAYTGIPIFLTTCLLAACGLFGGDEAAAQKAVRQGLKEPDAARFGAFVKTAPNEACLAVTVGGDGERMALLKRDADGKWIVASDGDIGHGLCKLKIMTMDGKPDAK